MEQGRGGWGGDRKRGMRKGKWCGEGLLGAGGRGKARGETQEGEGNHGGGNL